MQGRHPSRSHLPPHFASSDLPLTLIFGGHHATLRWLQPDDAPRLVEFFASHTEETVYQRYGYAGIHMTDEQAAQFVGVDQTQDAALGVFETTHDQSRLIAVGRYCLAAGGLRAAEVAFVVHEQRRHFGIATTLLAVLLAIARERKLDGLIALVHRTNTHMLALLRAFDASIETVTGTATLMATLSLGFTDDAAAASAHHHPAPAHPTTAAPAGHALVH